MTRAGYLVIVLTFFFLCFSASYDLLRWIYDDHRGFITIDEIIALTQPDLWKSSQWLSELKNDRILGAFVYSPLEITFFVLFALAIVAAQALTRASQALAKRLGGSSAGEIVPRQLSAEDRDKINNEVNQLLNQRFLITAAMLTLFAGFAALALQIKSDNERSEQFFLGFGLFVALLIFLLYLQSFFLRRLHRTYGTYLRLTSSSVWETDFDAYRRMGYFAYTKTETIMFMVVQILAGLLPIAVQTLHGERPAMFVEEALLLSVGFALAFVEFSMGFNGWFSDDAHTERQWRKILSKPIGHAF